jgi:hypothetical protein
VRPPEDDVVFVTVMSKVKDVVLLLPEVSLIDPDATVMTAVPPVDGEAVNVAVYVVPLPEKLLSVPNFADTSEAANVVTDSLTVNVTVEVDPEATEAGLALMDTVGAPVSYVIDSVLLAVLLLPAVSVNVVPAIEMEPVPEFVFVVGVNTTEYTVDDVVVSVPIFPPVTVMSSTAKLDDASDSVNVMVSVWPDVRVPDPARVMVAVGTKVSYAMDRVLLAVLPLPAVSVKVAPATEMDPVPEFVFVVGVKTTE